MLHYPAVLIPEDDGSFRVEAPDVPELNAIGDTEAEALTQAADVLRFAFAARMKSRWPLPTPSPADGRPTISLTLQAELKLALYRALLEDGLTPADLARRLGKGDTHARRLLNLDHANPTRQLEEALASLGRHVRVIVDRTAA